jgi:hypothetical protein
VLCRLSTVCVLLLGLRSHALEVYARLVVAHADACTGREALYALSLPDRQHQNDHCRLAHHHAPAISLPGTTLGLGFVDLVLAHISDHFGASPSATVGIARANGRFSKQGSAKRYGAV